MSHICALAHGPTALPQACEQGADTGDVTGGAPPTAGLGDFRTGDVTHVSWWARAGLKRRSAG